METTHRTRAVPIYFQDASNLKPHKPQIELQFHRRSNPSGSARSLPKRGVGTRSLDSAHGPLHRMADDSTPMTFSPDHTLSYKDIIYPNEIQSVSATLRTLPSSHPNPNTKIESQTHQYSNPSGSAQMDLWGGGCDPFLREQDTIMVGGQMSPYREGCPYPGRG